MYLAIADEAKQRGIAEVAPEVGIREVQPISELVTFSVGQERALGAVAVVLAALMPLRNGSRIGPLTAVRAE